MKICNVVAARPNFMKMAPIVLEMNRRGIDQYLVHTGQHYDTNMSDVFFEELGMPRPDVYLGVGSGSHAAQTAAVLTAFETTCLERKPDMVIVAGDVNSTVAAALASTKLRIPVAHVEAGLRSFDRDMPEEINRVLTDHMSDLLFATEEAGVENLRREGIEGGKVQLVGNCMVDSLLSHLEKALALKPWETQGQTPGEYGLVTLHRPSNVDQADALESLVKTLNRVSERIPLIFPVHPRTRLRIMNSGMKIADHIRLVDPLPYLTFLGLMAKSHCVLTDSGGIQEETTALGVPCLTLRQNTERPVTITQGTNKLVGIDPQEILRNIDLILRGDWSVGVRPSLWDGHAANRIVDAVTGHLVSEKREFLKVG